MKIQRKITRAVSYLLTLSYFLLRNANYSSTPIEAIKKHDNVTVFYNIFTRTKDDITLVQSIVNEQFSLLRPEHEVFVRSIGAQFDIENGINAGTKLTHIQHDATGDESGTLQLLWEYCKGQRPDRKVVYMHSKGSFHPHQNNDKLRKFLTKGALSKECANLPLSCNVCSSHMSPLPHPHTPGNMWLARCDYVKKLIEPKIFQSKMDGIKFPSEPQLYCVGKGRYAAEHWVHSHPSVMPCDLSDEKSFTWGYKNIPSHDFKIDLKPAPRFDVAAYKPTLGDCGYWGFSLEDRLLEYRTLYVDYDGVPESWWGWRISNYSQTQLLIW